MQAWRIEFIETWLWVLASAAFGAIWGSFINAAAYRLPRGISMVTQARSFCPSCKHQLAWYDNIPILSYLTLLGRCRYCSKPIGSRYLVVELVVASLCGFAAYQFFVLNRSLPFYALFQNWRMPPEIFAAQLFLIVDLVLLSVVDLESWLIPMQTTLLWVPVFLILAIVLPGLHPSASTWFVGSPRINALIDSVEGMVLGAGVLWAVGFITTLVTFCWFRLNGRPDRPKEGMGGGDCHMLAMIGALLGWKPALATIFFGIMIGCVTGISKIVWENFQRHRLGGKWKPWQPTYDMPASEGPPEAPAFWPLIVMGIAVVIVSLLLIDRSALTNNNRIQPTFEELQHLQGGSIGNELERFNEIFGDARVVPVYLMCAIGILLIIAFPFFELYLKKIDMLPQGSIVEQPNGEKQEVLEGHYIPFGPSLAAAALLVVFYDPLIRNLAFWFSNGKLGVVPYLTPYAMAGQGTLGSFLMALAKVFNGAVQHLTGG